MSDLVDVEREMTVPELAERAGAERRIIWRALQDGLIRARRERLGMRYGTARVPAAECDRVIRAVAVARRLGVPPAGLLRAVDVRSDGRTVTLILPTDDHQEATAAG